MIIRELTLDNYRVFAQPRTFHFEDRFTIIAGINGRGKTSILDGLATLLSQLLIQISPAQSGIRKVSLSDIHYGSEETQLVVRVLCVDAPIEFKLKFERKRKRQKTTQLPSAVREHVKAVYGDPERVDDQAPLVVYYTTDRAGYRLPRKLPIDIPHDQAVAYAGALSNRLVDYRDFMARYRVWCWDSVVADKKVSTDAKRAIKAFNTALKVFLDDFNDLRVLEDPLCLTIKKDECQLSLGQLSDGERSFLAIISDLVRRLVLANPLLGDPLQGAGVVLIDELELHLHPKWQREVVDKLRHTFPNIQFIATTHSPFIIQSLRPGELINLGPEEFGEYSDMSIEDITEDIMGVGLPQKSERYLQMMNAAEKYYSLLHQARNTKGKELEDLKYKLDTSVEPYGDDPAFTAFLKFQRSHMLREEE